MAIGPYVVLFHFSFLFSLFLFDQKIMVLGSFDDGWVYGGFHHLGKVDRA
jgi:hypothetical protein